jgi:hypothetical protein
MNTKTFKKPLAYYRELYTNQKLIEEMNKIKPIHDQDQKKPETIHDKIIKAVEAVSLVASVFVLCCSVWIVLSEFIKLFS